METTIKAGIFSGTKVPSQDLILIPDHSGSLLEWWPTHNRTPIFLSEFPPHKGWAITIEASPGPFNLPDYRSNIPTVGNDGAQEQAVLVQPTQLFTASLLYDGRVVNQASSLEVIDGAKAWERGETNARGRLYDALGLPGAIRTHANAATPAEKPSAKVESVASSAPATPTAPAISQEEIAAPKESDEKQAAPTNSRPMSSGAIEDNLHQQIATMAAIKGVKVPGEALASLESAKSFYKDLLMGKVSA